MADKEKVSVSTIDREIKDIVIKVWKAYDSNLIVLTSFFYAIIKVWGGVLWKS